MRRVGNHPKLLRHERAAVKQPATEVEPRVQRLFGRRG